MPSHSAVFIDCIATWIDVAIIITCFGTVWPFWCGCAVKLWYNHHQSHKIVCCWGVGDNSINCTLTWTCTFLGTSSIQFNSVQFKWIISAKRGCSHHTTPKCCRHTTPSKSATCTYTLTTIVSLIRRFELATLLQWGLARNPTRVAQAKKT